MGLKCGKGKRWKQLLLLLSLAFSVCCICSTTSASRNTPLLYLSFYCVVVREFSEMETYGYVIDRSRCGICHTNEHPAPAHAHETVILKPVGAIIYIIVIADNLTAFQSTSNDRNWFLSNSCSCRYRANALCYMTIIPTKVRTDWKRKPGRCHSTHNKLVSSQSFRQ